MIQNYTLKFNFVKEKIIDILKTCWILSQANYVDQKNSKKSLHVQEDSASGVQVGEIEQVIV